MPYSTNSASNIDTLATDFITFAVANGWTQNGSTTTQGTGKRFHLSKSNVYLNFRTFNTETPSMANGTADCRSQTGSLLVNLSTGYNGAQNWYDQTGYSVYGTQSSTAGIGMFSGSIPAYHFFAISGTGFEGLYIVVEAPAGEYSYLMMGMLDKSKYGADSAPIGMFASGTCSHALSARAKTLDFFTYGDVNASAWDNELPSAILNASVATSFSGFTYRTKGDFTSSLTSATPSAISSIGSYIPTALNMPNTFSSSSPMFPVIVGCQETSGNYWVPFGEMPNVFLTNLSGFNPADTVTISSDNYKVFPFYKISTSTTMSNNSYNLGFAIKY